jgi:hypothetical protein
MLEFFNKSVNNLLMMKKVVSIIFPAGGYAIDLWGRERRDVSIACL